MRICDAFALSLVLLVAAAPSWAAADPIRQFILERHGSPELAEAILTGDSRLAVCRKTPTHHICVSRESDGGGNDNPLLQRAMQKTALLRIKYRLYKQALADADCARFRNKKKIEDFYLSEVQKNNAFYLLKNIEYAYLVKDGRRIALAALPVGNLRNEVNELCGKRRFLEDYAAYILPEAEDMLRKRDHASALPLLKELHDLGLAKADAYILAADAFLKNGKTDDARRVAMEVLHDLSDQLDATLAERLGDIFMESGQSREAETSYAIAMERFAGELSR